MIDRKGRMQSGKGCETVRGFDFTNYRKGFDKIDWSKKDEEKRERKTESN